MSRRLSVWFVSLGILVFVLVASTLWTFGQIDTDNARKGLLQSQHTALFRTQLLTTALLRGEETEADVIREINAFDARQTSLIENAGVDALTVNLIESLQRSWQTYRETTSLVITASKELDASADEALGLFAPWISDLSKLEITVRPDPESREERMRAVADCRASTTGLSSGLLKLLSAPPGDASRQAQLVIEVSADEIEAALGALGEDAAELSASLEEEQEAVASHWEGLKAAIGEVVSNKENLLGIAYPSARTNLVTSFEEMIALQMRASETFDLAADKRRCRLTEALLAGLTIVILLVAVAMMAVRKQVVVPIRRLTLGTVALSQDLRARIDINSSDELGQLAGSFNVMAERLLGTQEQLRDWAETLEDQVRERTQDLQSAHEKLVEESAHRERVEAELRLAQKLESVGQLAAGIAHEINTPIQYVNDNVTFLNDSFGDVLPALSKATELAHSVLNEGNIIPIAEDLLKFLEDADVEYLAEEVPRSLQQTIGGIQQVARIVKAMKGFSHPGADSVTSADLNQAIDQTITVAKSEWKYVAELETDFDPELPPVQCLPGEMNQVILNMIVNAAHSISDVNPSEPGVLGKIKVTTRLVGEYAEIRIADSGGGIPEEIRGRIFDQFFTTKEIGRGTGQGLAIAHGVVVGKHGGTITVESEVGVGSTFIIRIPVLHAGAEEVAAATGC